MSESYEYKTPHGHPPAHQNSYTPRLEWEVALSLGSELIQKRVSAEDKVKALKRVVMDLSRELNQQPATLFKRIYADKNYTVKPMMIT